MRTSLLSALRALRSLRAASVAAPVLLAGASLIVAPVVPAGARLPLPLFPDDVFDVFRGLLVGEDCRVELAVLHRALVSEVFLATAGPAVGVEGRLLGVLPFAASGLTSCARWSSARRVLAVSGIVRSALLMTS